MSSIKSAAILLSRQSLYPSGSSAWVKTCVEAVLWVKSRGYTLMTSVGIQTWELLLSLAVQYSIPQIIIIPSRDEKDFYQQCSYYKKQFHSNDCITTFHQVQNEHNEKKGAHLRDEYIFKKAQYFIPVSISKKGTMQTFLSTLDNNRVTIDNSFLIPYEKKKGKSEDDLSIENICDQSDIDYSEYIFHWTRTSNRPWPTEDLFQYYYDIVNSREYSRSAYCTLENILSHNQITSSTRHMPAGTQCVSFTGKKPAEFIPHMRWRKRYSEMSFEPYGIGIRKSVAEALGIRKVIYTDLKVSPDHPDRWITQSAGVKGDWISEDEYRCKGVCDLSSLNKLDIIVICRSPQEAQRIYLKYNRQTFALFNWIHTKTIAS